jgi:hypothetical protein
MPLTEQDKYWIATTQSAITRARRILLSTTLIAAWLIAVQLIELVQWEPIRKPASENYAHALVTRLRSFWLVIPRKDVRDSDLSRFAQPLSTEPAKQPSQSSLVPDTAAAATAEMPASQDTVTIQISSSASMSEAVDWCERYRGFIRSQWSQGLNRAVDMLITRAKISSEALPPSTMNRPQVGLPLLGIPVAADDATLVGAIMLFIAMLWLCFSGFHARDSMKMLRTKCSDPDFAKAWLPHQFLFVNQPAQAPERVAYPLIYLPYGAVLFGLLVNASSVVVQVLAYSKLAGFTGVPLLDGLNGLPWYKQETLGILLIRYSIELAAIYWLFTFGRRVCDP